MINMTLGKIIQILIGVGFFAIGIFGVISGEIVGVGISGGTNTVYKDTSPFHFWISVLLAISMGALLVWGAIEKKRNNR